MEFEHSRTFKALIHAENAALAACGRYRLYAEQARSEGLEQLADLLEGFARTELTRARLLAQQRGPAPDLLHSLAFAARLLRKSWYATGRQYALTAQQEGFEETAELFWKLAEVHRTQDTRLRRAGRLLEAGGLFARPETCSWACRRCGHTHRSAGAPEQCPLCGAPQTAMQKDCDL